MCAGSNSFRRLRSKAVEAQGCTLYVRTNIQTTRLLPSSCMGTDHTMGFKNTGHYLCYINLAFQLTSGAAELPNSAGLTRPL